MRKILMVILAGAMFLTLLAGCDGEEKGSSSAQGETQGDSVDSFAEQKLSKFKQRTLPHMETIPKTEPFTTMSREEFFDKLEIKEPSVG